MGALISAPFLTSLRTSARRRARAAALVELNWSRRRFPREEMARQGQQRAGYQVGTIVSPTYACTASRRVVPNTSAPATAPPPA